MPLAGGHWNGNPLKYEINRAILEDMRVRIRALLEKEWPGSPAGGDTEPLTDPGLHPTYFVLAERCAVLAYARTIWMHVPWCGTDLEIYGLGDVVTARPARSRGFGSDVVEAATARIRSDCDADAAILLTTPQLVAFYVRDDAGIVGRRAAVVLGDGHGHTGASGRRVVALSARPAIA
jgi:GNAT superfamily N-acetyltransferase